MFYQKDVETMRRADIEALQLQKLKKMVDYCYNNIPFYHERLQAAGVTGDKNPFGYSVYPLYNKGRYPR